MPSAVAEILSLALSLAAIALLVRICWTDFFLLKIWNRDLIALFAVTVILLLLSWPEDLLLRLWLGSIMFGLSFVFWLLRALGAGDVKLLGIVGCLIRPEHAIPMLLLVIVFVLVIFLVYKWSGLFKFVPQLAGRRVLELAETGRIPYGVPITLATIGMMLLALLGGR